MSQVACDRQDPPTRKEASAPKKWRRRCVRAFLGLLILYVGAGAAFCLLQDWILFPVGRLPDPPSSTPPEGTVVIWIDLAGSERVEGWFFPAPGCDAQNPAPAVVFFHGAREIIDYQMRFVDGYHRLGWSVLLPEYRGYARSGGRPSQWAIRSDNVRFYDALAGRSDVDPSRIVFHGRSLGGAIAADLALERKPAGLILQSTFTSTGALTRPVVVPDFAIRHPFRTDRAVERLDVPILIFHGTHDWVIGVNQGRRLYELAGNAKAKYVEYPCGHSDLPGAERTDAYWQEIEKLLSPVMWDEK